MTRRKQICPKRMKCKLNAGLLLLSSSETGAGWPSSASLCVSRRARACVFLLQRSGLRVCVLMSDVMAQYDLSVNMTSLCVVCLCVHPSIVCSLVPRFLFCLRFSRAVLARSG